MKGFAVVMLAMGALAVSGVPASAGGQSGFTSSRVSKPEVVCLNDSTERLSNRARPDHCDYYDGRAPGTKINRSADFPTRQVVWSHWGHATAFGRGEYFESGRWLPARLKLRRPKVVCGQRVFTRIQLNLETCKGSWTGLAKPIPIESCARTL